MAGPAPGADGRISRLIERTIGYTRLVRWNPEWTEVVPDVAESLSVNPDGTEYTFNLREGTRWSDGEPSPPTTSCSGTMTC